MNNNNRSRQNRCENDCDNCILDTLKIINMLQCNACPENCLNSCDRPALGGSGCTINCNTRPVMLYTCSSGSTPIAMPISRNETEMETSTVFRVEKIEGCCATFRVLAPNDDTTSTYPYRATDSFFTINSNCLCMIRCLNDTYVECVC